MSEGKQKKGCMSRIITIFIILAIIGFFMNIFDGPKIKGDTAYIDMDLYFQGAAKNGEWAEKIWKAVQNDKVEKVIVNAKAQYTDKYGKKETYKEEIEITSLISPLSEVRKYTKSEFASQFGDYIVGWISMRMDKIAN